MKKAAVFILLAGVISTVVLFTGCTSNGSRQVSGDPLPSWNDGAAKQAIMEFVGKVTHESGPGLVPPAERIAVFDNDGTLWSEQPAYFQLLFAIDRIRALAPEHPEWITTQPFKAVLENDMKALAAFGNSDGDLQMLQWTEAGGGERLMFIVHHTDHEREWAYGRESSIGHLDKALDEARAKGWTVADMKADWKVIYPFELEK